MKFKLLQVLSMGLLVAGCSTDDDVETSDPQEYAAPLVARAGAVLAEVGDPAAGASVNAQFVVASGVSPQEAFAALELWVPDHELDLDACSLQSNQTAVTEEMSLRFLDVGTVSVDVLGASYRLAPRSLPDMVSGISGVVYGSDEGFEQDRIVVPYVPGSPFAIHAPGGEETGDFLVNGVMPRTPEITAVSSQTLDRDAEVAHRDGDLTVQWRTLPGSDDTELYLDIESGEGAPATLRCRVEDDGDFTVPEAILRQMAAIDPALELTLRRAHVTAVHIDGLDDAQVVLTAKAGITLILQ